VNESDCFSLVGMDDQLDGKQEIVDHLVQVNESDCFSLVVTVSVTAELVTDELLIDRSMILTVFHLL
jgi:hypothetical protein